MISVVLVDDHPVIRQGLRRQIETMKEIRVVGEADNGESGIELVDRLRPNLLIVDMMMSGMTGCEVIHQVVQRCPEVRRVIFSMHSEENYVLQAFRSGAHGYILKGSDMKIVEEAIRCVTGGRHYIGPDVTDEGLNTILERAKSSLLGAYETLSPREREVMQLAASGHTCHQISEQLFISPRTAEVHRRNLMRKLSLKTRTDLTRYAISKGLLSLNN